MVKQATRTGRHGKTSGAKKRPSAEVNESLSLCPGYNGQPCIFNVATPGSPAVINLQSGETHCLFCDPEKLRQQCATNDAQINDALKKFKAHDAKVAKKQKKLEKDLQQECENLCPRHRRELQSIIEDIELNKGMPEGPAKEASKARIATRIDDMEKLEPKPDP